MTPLEIFFRSIDNPTSEYSLSWPDLERSIRPMCCRSQPIGQHTFARQPSCPPDGRLHDIVDQARAALVVRSHNSCQPAYNIFCHIILRPAGYPASCFYLPDSKYYPLSSSAADKRSKNSVTAECFRKIDAGQAMLTGPYNAL